MMDTYDLVAIGAGPAGESATELAAFFGHRSAIVERDRPGGTVTTTGGVPTKTLREAALYLSGFREGDVYGLRMPTTPEVVLDTIRKTNRGTSASSLQKLTADEHRRRAASTTSRERRDCVGNGNVIVTGERTDASARCARRRS